MPLARAFLLVLALSPSLTFACTSEEAASLVQTELLDLVNPANGCRIVGVGAEQKNWWGYRYYPVRVECTADPSIKAKTVRILINEQTGACEYGV